MAGPAYRAKFDADKCLARADKTTFIQSLGLQEEPPANYTVDGFLNMLKTYGPLWVTRDSSTATFVSLHARIMTGMYGDGTPDGTFVLLIDPADGQRHQESFSHFQQTFEQVARDVAPGEPLWIQVVHN
jgi:hypothetical protein